MSNEFYDDDDNVDFGVDQPGDSQGIKNLRKEYRATQRALAKANSELETLKKDGRKSSIEKALSAKNVNPKVAAFIPDDVEADGIDKWLTEYGDLFNIAPKADAEKPAPTDPPAAQVSVEEQATRDAIARAQATEAAGNTPLTLGLDAARRALADSAGKSYDDVVASLTRQGLVGD